MTDPTESESQKESLSMFSVIKSVLAAGFGVQSNKNREKDFGSGKLLHFIVAGIGATIIFLFFVWLLVQWALNSA